MSTTQTMTRQSDPATSRAAAERLLPHLSDLEHAVLCAIREHSHGGEDITDRELESLEDFEGYGPSTIRRRRTTLVRQGYVESTGRIRGGCQCWRAVPIETLIERIAAERSGCLF